MDSEVDEEQSRSISSTSLEQEQETKSVPIARYQKISKVGEGTYAVVYEGLDTQTKHQVAIKRIKRNSSGFGLDISAIRELQHLRNLHHPNLVNLLDVYIPPGKNQLHLVLGFYPYDLEGILRDKTIVISPGDVKSWLVMLLRGVAYCHERGVLHRDLKPNNLLLAGQDGQLKIADFGLARFSGYPLDPPMTPSVVTRWYRAPELLFGARAYSSAIDIWAVGCIFAEMLLRTPLFAGDSDLAQLKMIAQLLGPPDESLWPGVTSLPDYVNIAEGVAPKRNNLAAELAKLFPAASPDALDLLQRMLIYDPAKRISAIDALSHPYFAALPRPTLPVHLPLPLKKKDPYPATEKEELRRLGLQPRKLVF